MLKTVVHHLCFTVYQTFYINVNSDALAGSDALQIDQQIDLETEEEGVRRTPWSS